MLQATKEQKGNVLAVRLIGTVEETVNFDGLIGPPPTELEVNCKEIARMNSVGIKSWIKYFQSCQTKGTKLKFTECSTAVVEQINLISNFICGGSVESIVVPFACTSCKSELAGVFTTENLKKMELNVPDLQCSKCGNKAVFDDIPEEFFGFLLR